METVTFAVITESGELYIIKRSIDDLEERMGNREGLTTDELIYNYVVEVYGYDCIHQVIKSFSIDLYDTLYKLFLH